MAMRFTVIDTSIEWRHNGNCVLAFLKKNEVRALKASQATTIGAMGIRDCESKRGLKATIQLMIKASNWLIEVVAIKSWILGV